MTPLVFASAALLVCGFGVFAAARVRLRRHDTEAPALRLVR